MTGLGCVPPGGLTEWAALWQELVERSRAADPARSQGDYWCGRAESFDARMTAHTGGRDLLLERVLVRVRPEDTVLDIGAGTGGWTIPLARRAARVVAVDNSPSMLEVLGRKIAAEGLANVEVHSGTWPEEQAGRHDHVLAVHSCYGTTDLPGFIAAMTASARRTCYLGITFPIPTSAVTQAAIGLWGSRWGRPDFVVAYNVMLEMGLMPNVWVDEGSEQVHSVVPLDEALVKAKRLLGLGASDLHDPYLREFLQDVLEPEGGGFRWPQQSRSALVWWAGAS